MKTITINREWLERLIEIRKEAPSNSDFCNLLFGYIDSVELLLKETK